ncbi:MAG: hypothetical protein HQM09_24545 [Candidatus Riflebacteria bacterium]|nr:hypothetical protein [Candidatus Riflebacteria bacterium]
MRIEEIIVRCHKCGTKNRLKPHTSDLVPICGNCKTSIISENIETTKDLDGTTTVITIPSAKEKKPYRILWAIGLILFIVAMVGYMKNEVSINVSQDVIAPKPKVTDGTASEKAKATQKMIALFVAGVKKMREAAEYTILSEQEKESLYEDVLEQYKTDIASDGDGFFELIGYQIQEDFQFPKSPGVSESEDNDSCPFSITTSGDSDLYEAKLIDTSTDEEIFFHFVGGGKFEGRVPPGNYDFSYGFGKKWYGGIFKFGDEDNFFKGETILSFRREGRTLKGHEIVLVKLPGGNFETHKISKKEFLNHKKGRK